VRQIFRDHRDDSIHQWPGQVPGSFFAQRRIFMSQPIHDKQLAKLARLVGIGVAKRWSKILARRRASKERGFRKPSVAKRSSPGNRQVDRGLSSDA
jgi:hypothetical protein